MVFNEEKKAVDWIFAMGTKRWADPGKAALRQDDRKFFFQSFFSIWTQNGFMFMNAPPCTVKHWKSWTIVRK